jgi:hypothetical protein
MHAAYKIVNQILENEDEDVGAQMQRIVRSMGGEPVVKKTEKFTSTLYPNGREIRQYLDGTTAYLLRGRLHREDGPAAVLADGTKLWSLNGRFHREDGPAVEWFNGTVEWYLNDQKISEKTHARRTQNR